MEHFTRIDAVADDTYRIGTFWPEYGITVNQFLIADERPALVHTGTHPSYDNVRKAIAQVIDPKKLEFVIVPHFEADECGGMGRFIREAPQSTLVCSDVGAGINLSGWDYSGPVKGVRDGDIIELGKHTLRFLETPHVHHWDSMMLMDETTNALFPADLFLQPGEQGPHCRENLGKEMCQLYREAGIFAAREPVLNVAKRLQRMNFKQILPMHGGCLSGEVIPKFYDALHTERFWFDGKVFGRALPS
jgi:flavorubredoxin